MNTIAIDENSANEVIGYFYAENQDKNIRLAINEKCHEKTNFSQGKGFLFYMLLIMSEYCDKICRNHSSLELRSRPEVLQVIFE